jgi:hypothetical protein
MKDQAFKRLFEQEEVPKELKREIHKTMDTAKLFLSIADLFSDKLLRAHYELFNGGTGEAKSRHEGEF